MWSAGIVLHLSERSARTRKRHDMYVPFLVLALAVKNTTQKRRASLTSTIPVDDIRISRLHRKVQCVVWRRPPAASRLVFRRRL